MEPVSSLPLNATLLPSLSRIRLDLVASSSRFSTLDRLHAYYRGTQYEHKRYDFNGRMRGYGEEADIAPGWYVPLKQRRPSRRRDIAKMIVERFTAMVFGCDRFPQVNVQGDEDCEDFVRTLATVALLPAKLAEARDLGGATGAAAMSFCFVGGVPQVNVHNAKHVTVLRWVDRYRFVIGAALETYKYPVTVWGADGKPKEVAVFFARYWDEQREIIWDPIPEQMARIPGQWTNLPRKEAAHGWGFAPIYWCQNRPDSTDVDGGGDFDGQCDNIDELNLILSATSRGTIANLDPTLVIKEDPSKNTGGLKKGSENAIWASGGASYLQLGDESVKAGLLLAQSSARDIEDACSVVMADPKEIASKALSAAALRMIYMPMISMCDIYRSQYGNGLLIPLLLGMLRAARSVASSIPGPVEQTADGKLVQPQAVLVLPLRAVSSVAGPGSKPVITMVPRKPGTSEYLTLNWPPYFPNTWADIKQASEALSAANGKRPIISQRTAVQNAVQLFGVSDVDQELEDIEDDEEKARARFADMDDGVDDGNSFSGAEQDEPKE